jgi:hydrogenase maturation factor HypE
MSIILDNGNGVTYSRLADASHTQVILTDYNDSTLTPILVNNTSATIENVLVDTLNEAFDTLLSFAPTDVKDDITKFKTEIGVDTNGKVTTQTVSDYISKNN